MNDTQDEKKEAADAKSPGEPKEEVKETPKTEEAKIPEVKAEEKKAEPKKKKSEVKLNKKQEDIVKAVEGLSVMELADLVKALEDKFGVTAAAPVAVAGVAAGNGTDEGPKEEQTVFNVVLSEMGAQKIQVIKAVRELVPTLGLADAKKLVESAPKPVLEGVGKDAAGEAKKKLEAAGAKVELK